MCFHFLFPLVAFENPANSVSISEVCKVRKRIGWKAVNLEFKAPPRLSTLKKIPATVFLASFLDTFKASVRRSFAFLYAMARCFSKLRLIPKD